MQIKHDALFLLFSIIRKCFGAVLKDLHWYAVRLVCLIFFIQLCNYSSLEFLELCFSSLEFWDRTGFSLVLLYLMHSLIFGFLSEVMSWAGCGV